MKQHIDALFDFLSEQNFELMPPTMGHLHGILYEIGSQWDYYKLFFERVQE